MVVLWGKAHGLSVTVESNFMFINGAGSGNSDMGLVECFFVIFGVGGYWELVLSSFLLWVHGIFG
jgi:hypothetical protein